MQAGLKVLAQHRGRRIFVMGDMLELGLDAKRYHTEIGLDARNLGIEVLMAVGDLSQYAVTAFGSGAQHFIDKVHLIAALKPLLQADSVVLLKASRGMRLEDVLAAIQ